MWDAIPDHDAPTITHALTNAVTGATPQMLDRFPRLRVIASCGAGLDRFDFDLLARRNIKLHHTGHLMTSDTAEMAVTLVFALLRGVVENDKHVRSGAWSSQRATVAERVSGKRVGIVGLGQIGTTVARMLHALGMTVAYTGPRAKPQVPWPYVPALAELAAESDILILTCSGGPATRHLVDASVLAALGPRGYLVNVSRGSVVDESALLDALETQRIAGAGLDVFENEPSPDPRFARLKNAVLQPHAATFTRENRAELAAEIVRLLSLQD
jgi:lactate dehydrogenase-like 2-hydroxyacid dehydrogenase